MRQGYKGLWVWILLVQSALVANGDMMVSNIVFYVHTKLSQPSQTVEVVAIPYAGSSNGGPRFGTVSVGDMLLTQDQSNTSKAVGRLKSMILNADSQPPFHAHEFLTAVIETQQFNGTFAINGRDVAFGSELSIVGGTGDFRGVKGWANFTHVEYIAPDSVTFVNATLVHPPHFLFHDI